jgi:hypothetical protein
MKEGRFLLKLFWVMAGFILLDKGIGGLLQHFYFNIKHGEQARTGFAIDSCRAETVILGSSRAAHHYVSPVIGQILNSSCYNAGKDKQRLPYCLAMLKMMYRRYSPRRIILDLNPTAFEKNENGLEELSVLLPYYQTHPEIRSILNKRNRFEWIKTWSRLYCYNSLPLKIIFNNLSVERDAREKDGYVPLVIHKELIPARPEALPASLPLDSNLVNCFEAAIELAKIHHTEIVVVISPIYYKLPENLVTIQKARSLCYACHIPFLDFSQSRPFIDNGPACYLDMGHLNDSSALLFSRMLADSLAKIR